MLGAERVRKSMDGHFRHPVVVCPCGCVGLVQELNMEVGIEEHDGRVSQTMSGKLLFTAGREDYDVTAFPSEIPIIDVSAAIERPKPPPPNPPPPPDCFATSDELFDSIIKKS